MNNDSVGTPSQDEINVVGVLPRNRDADAIIDQQSRKWVWGVVALVIVAIGFFVLKAVGDAATYFRTTDEASAQRADLGTRRFRLEGCVVAGSVARSDTTTTFAVSGDTNQIRVVHTGTPPALFEANMPVVLEGRFDNDSDVYLSDRIMVRHSEEYVQVNPERVSQGQCQ